MLRNSKSNREKIYDAGGVVLFGKIYNCSVPPPSLLVSYEAGTITVFMTTFVANATIKKSPESTCNKDKICKKGMTLYVLGDVTGPAQKEFLVFSSDSWVFKRKWSELAGFVTHTGTVSQSFPITSVGEVKDLQKKQARKREREGDPRVQAFEVQFTGDPKSTVWFTEPGIKHMNNLVRTYHGYGLLPGAPTELWKHTPSSINEEENQENERNFQQGTGNTPFADSGFTDDKGNFVTDYPYDLSSSSSSSSYLDYFFFSDM